ncbi:hypothetical protein, partial [Klebsiella variicola]|uniref:hypothetical protein n=1 Tax=Klebsiella variicola TaxID=244366 RepID=UPI0039C056D0
MPKLNALAHESPFSFNTMHRGCIAGVWGNFLARFSKIPSAFVKALVFIAMLVWFLAPGTHAVAATPQTIT